MNLTALDLDNIQQLIRCAGIHHGFLMRVDCLEVVYRMFDVFSLGGLFADLFSQGLDCLVGFFNSRLVPGPGFGFLERRQAFFPLGGLLLRPLQTGCAPRNAEDKTTGRVVHAPTYVQWDSRT